MIWHMRRGGNAKSKRNKLAFMIDVLKCSQNEHSEWLNRTSFHILQRKKLFVHLQKAPESLLFEHCTNELRHLVIIAVFSALQTRHSHYFIMCKQVSGNHKTCMRCVFVIKAHISVCRYGCMCRWRYNCDNDYDNMNYAAPPSHCVGKNSASLCSLSLISCWMQRHHPNPYLPTHTDTHTLTCMNI